ncbi:MAG: hypothetical protein QM708_15765 [Propioniciclava sp.]|uniref:HAAS signaling domain-containing protein n=1 Tax=Propioniciclava sp. TaxID=2038686 RepID=UPI0039E667D9
MIAVDKYLTDLEAALAGLRPAAREAIVDGVRSHIADALEDGRAVDSILAALGTPEAVARNAREELGAAAGQAAGRDAAERAQRMLHWAALGLAVVTAVLMVRLAVPMHSGIATNTGLEYRLLSTLGIASGLLPLIPAAFTLLPLMLPGRWRHAAGWVAAVLITMFSLLGEFMDGLFTLPLALLLWAAMIVPGWIRRGGGGLWAHIWRTVGAAAIALPAILVTGASLGGTFGPMKPLSWAMTAAVLLVALLFGTRRPYLDAIVATLGAGLMIGAMWPGGFLMLGGWLAGGLWVVAGLVGIATRPARSIASGW